MNNDSIYLLTDSGNLEKVPERSYDSEELLHELVEKYPQLLAGEQINPDEPVRWILIKRGPNITSGEEQSDIWSVNHLLLDQNAIPTFVKVQYNKDARMMREVVGMMLDYAANSQTYWSVNRIRDMASSQYNGPEGVDEAIANLLGRGVNQGVTDVVDAFWRKVENNLRSGQVRLLFVADRLPGELRRIIEFLNEQMTKVEVLGVELPQFVGSDFRALVPRLIGQTEAMRQIRESTERSSRQTMKTEFLSRVSKELKPFFSDLISEAEKQGMQVSWDPKGFSLKVENDDGKWQTLFYENDVNQSNRSGTSPLR
ncbi:hypothetical protein ACFLV5_02395 [Chloroflexota bacterium]